MIGNDEQPLSQQLFQRGASFLGCRYPLLCGAMTWVSDPALVAAVAAAGGFGALAGGNMPPELLVEDIAQTRRLLGDKPFGVNLITIGSCFHEQLEAVCAQHVPFIIFAGGLPRNSDIAAARESGAKVIGFAPTEGVAHRLVAAGIDALVIEGSESGGHVGPVSTMVLVQQVLFHCAEVPVFVAGGIADGRMMAHLMLLGAAGIQMGTRFTVAKECRATPAFKHAIIAANARDARQAAQFDPEVPVSPVRSLYNAAATDFEKLQLQLLNRCYNGELTHREVHDELERFWLGGLRRAALEGDVERGSVMAGQSAGMVKKECTVAEIFADMLNGCEEELRRTREILG